MSRQLLERAFREAGLSETHTRSIVDRVIAQGPNIDLAAEREALIHDLRSQIKTLQSERDLAMVQLAMDTSKLERMKLEKGYVGVFLSRIFGDLHTSPGLTNLTTTMVFILLILLTIK